MTTFVFVYHQTKEIHVTIEAADKDEAYELVNGEDKGKYSTEWEDESLVDIREVKPTKRTGFRAAAPHYYSDEHSNRLGG